MNPAEDTGSTVPRAGFYGISAAGAQSRGRGARPGGQVGREAGLQGREGEPEGGGEGGIVDGAVHGDEVDQAPGQGAAGANWATLAMPFMSHLG